MGHGAWVDYLRNLLLECSSVATPAPLPALCIVRPCQWRIRPAAITHTTTTVPRRVAAPLSSGGVPPIGQIDEMVGEPMIYKEALTAINRGDFVTAVKFLTTAAVRSPSALHTPDCPPPQRVSTFGSTTTTHQHACHHPPPTTTTRHLHQQQRVDILTECLGLRFDDLDVHCGARDAPLNRVQPEQQACDRELGA